MLDVGQRVECDDQYWLCYSAMLVCEYKQWEMEAVMENAEAMNATDTVKADPKVFYMRGCAKKPVFGLYKKMCEK